MNRLFVYGSLQPGGPNEHVLAEMEGQWHSGSVKGVLVEKGWGSQIGCPGLILDARGSDIPGQVFSSRDLTSALSDLDQFEGEQYERVVAPVRLDSGTKVGAFVYVLRED